MPESYYVRVQRELGEIRSEISTQRGVINNNGGARLGVVASDRNRETDEEIIRMLKIGYAYGASDGKAEAASRILAVAPDEG